MSNNPIIKTGTEKILDSLDNIKRASPKAFLHTRIMARLTKNRTDNRWERVTLFISKPAFAVATFALFILINIAVIFHFSGNTASALRNDSASVMSDNEYNLSVSSLYDINPE
ncbi:MAG: hypothetical protein IT214_10605 [Chitinophagaceae bacterium]|jgi:hypothetical protein|nr:hypothetical protein [Chitinophagaceae bacterium]OQY96854.1 MAG: hypothetical protein B6D37_00900 [Sphingobacteriales bacterium UTBCD1]